MATSKNNDKGKAGEELAIAFLRSKGLTIEHVNWRAGHNELDIIAKDGKTTVIIEVKARTTDNKGHPEQGVTKQKINQIKKAAHEYLLQVGWDLIRFDVVAITFWPGAETEILHFEDAFF
jgi:putative endonuclease